MIKKGIDIFNLFENDKAEAFEYENYKEGILVTGYNGTKSFVKIPESIDGKPVIAFGESKFAREYSKPAIMLPQSFSVFDVSKFSSGEFVSSSWADVPSNKWFGDVYLAEGNVNFIIENNILYSHDRKKLIFAFDRSRHDDIVPDYVEILSERAFSESTTITIPSSVKMIEGHPAGQFSFEGNDNYIVDGDIVYSKDMKTAVGFYERPTSHGKGYNAEKNTDITSLTLPSSLEEILPYAFCNLDKLKTLVLPESIKRIGRKAFEKSPIKEIKIPKSVEYIDDEAFSYLKLKKITVKKKNSHYQTDKTCLYRINEDGSKTLMKCFDTKITEYEMLAGTSSVNKAAFKDCKNLKQIVFPDSLHSFGFVLDRYWNSDNIEVISCNGSMFVKDGILYERINGGYKVVTIAGIKDACIIEGTIEIGDEACGNVNSVQNLTLPSSLRKIGSRAFYPSQLKTIQLNDGLEYIGREAFASTAIKSVCIPSSLKYIAHDAFRYSAIEEYTGCSSEYATIDGVLFTADMKNLVDFPRNKELREYDVPDTVEDIGCAFLGTRKFDRISLSKNIKKLGKDSLNFSADVTVMPDSLEYINERCIEGENYREPKVVNLKAKPGSLIIEYVKSLYTADNYRGSIPTLEIEGFDEKYNEKSPIYYLPDGDELLAVYVKDDIKEITLPQVWAGRKVTYSPNFLKGNTTLEKVSLENGFEAVPFGVFRYSCIKEVVIPNTVHTLEARAFEGCKEIEEIKLPESIRTIQEYAFSSCPKLERIELNEQIEKIGKGAFAANKQLQKITIPGTVKAIEPNLFKLCENIIEIDLSEGVETIGEDVFFGCKKLERLILPKTVVSISDAIFSDMHRWKDLYLNPKTEYVVEMGSYAESFLKSYDCKYDLILVSPGEPEKKKIYTTFNAFTCEVIENNEVMVSLSSSNYSETDVVIPEEIEGMPVTRLKLGNMFINNVLTSISIPKTIVSFGDKPSFYGAKAIQIHIASDNPAFCVVDNVIYSKDMKHLVRSFNCECEVFIIPETVQFIDEKAFERQHNLKKVVLPDGIISIGASAFEGCENLNVVIGAEKAENVDASAYIGTPFAWSSDELVLGTTLVSYRKTDSRKYVVPEGITEICNSAFRKNQDEDQLEEIILPTTLKIIGSNAFESRNKINTINIPEGVECIRSGAFSGCRGLNIVNIASTVKEISGSAFGELYNIAKSLREINVAEDNSSYKSVDGILYSSDGTKLLKVPNGYDGVLTVQNGTEIITRRALEKNEGITRVVLPCSIKHIEENAFQDCRAIEEVVFDNCMDVSVREYAFAGCSNLKKINLDCISNIGYAAFSACKNMDNISLSSKIIEKNAFTDCKSLSSVALNRTEIINDSAFAKCNISDLQIPDSVKEIGRSAFEANPINCATIPKTVETIGDHAFGGAEKIVIYDNLKGKIGTLCVKGLLGSHIYSGVMTSYEITVLSADDDSEKFTTVIYNDNTIKYSARLEEAWGDKNTFNFKIVDEYFPEIKNADMKIKTAIERIARPYMLADDAKKIYIAYLARNAKRILKYLIDQNSFDAFLLMADNGVIKKSNIEEILNYSIDNKAIEFSAFLMEYKKNVLKIKEKDKDPFKDFEMK